MRKRSIFLFFALIAQFCPESSWAHVNFLPRTPAQLVQVGSEEILLHPASRCRRLMLSKI